MGHRNRRPLFVASIALLTLAMFVQPAGATGSPWMLQTDCDLPPSLMALSEVSRGMTGKAYTTLEGREISEFDVEVLGVLPKAVYPLIDLVIVEVSGPAVEQVGGIAGGFSGSPVYIDGKLLGAIAYGFFGNPWLGGITPAESMVQLGSFPASPIPELNPAAAAQLELIEASVGPLGAPRPIPVPFGVSGSPDWVKSMQDRAQEAGLPISIYPATGSHNGSGSGSDGHVLPGDSLSAVLSEGDNYAFGTGTATYCDGSTVIGFGHPMLWTGEVSMSMNKADIVTVVEDSTGFGNFKLATLGEAVGRIDFDGNAGIRGIAGEAAPSVPITSHVRFEEYGTSRSGRTDAYVTDDLWFSVGWTSAGHLLINLDAVSGTGYRPGSSSVEWTVSGRRADGTPFTASFDEKYWDAFSITDASVYELATFVDQIVFNPFEEVDLTSVDIGSAELFRDRRTLDIAKVTVTTSSRPDPVTSFGFIEVQPGDEVSIEVVVRPFGGTEFTETLQLTIPEDLTTAYGSLVVRGGSPDFYWDPYYGFYSEDIADFDDLLSFLQNRNRNYELVAELTLYEEGFVEERPEEENLPQTRDGFFIQTNGVPVEQNIVRVKDFEVFDSVVTGEVYFDVQVYQDVPPVAGTLTAFLDGASVVGGGDPDGSGSATLYVEGDMFSYDIVLDQVDEPLTSAHIHAGFPGEAGPVVLDLEYGANGLSGVVFADPFLLEEILAFPEGFYLQVHSEVYPDGAVRGQLASDFADGGAGLAYVTADGLWYLDGFEPFHFGTRGDIPFLGDWDGDGLKTAGLYRPSTGEAFIRNTNDTGVADASFVLGAAGARALVGDWNGDGIDSFGVYHQARGQAVLYDDLSIGEPVAEFYFGMPGDVPFTGDFDGDGTTNLGLHRPTTGLVYMRMSHTTGVADVAFYWGVPGDLVLAGDWDGDGIDTVGLVRPSEGMFYLRNDNSDGVADAHWVLAMSDAGVSVLTW
jgi:hypothetical protein